MYLAYTYFVRNKITNQFYYGSRGANIRFKRTSLEDFWIHYFTSAPKITELRREYGNDSFEFLIVYESESYEECYWLEQKLISENFNNSLSINKHYVDKASGNTMFSMAGKIHSDETRIKQSNSAKGREHNYDVWNKGQTKENNSLIAKLSAAISKAKKGKPGPKHTEKSIQLMKDNWIKKIDEGYISHWKGKTRKTKGGHWYNNGIIDKVLPDCPVGWLPGRVKKIKAD